MQTMMVDYFPRAHTAIAEWLACIMFMVPMKKRLKNWQLGLLYAGVLAAFLFTNQDQAPFLLIIFLDILYMMVMQEASCPGQKSGITGLMPSSPPSSPHHWNGRSTTT